MEDTTAMVIEGKRLSVIERVWMIAYDTKLCMGIAEEDDLELLEHIVDDYGIGPSATDDAIEGVLCDVQNQWYDLGMIL